MEYQRFGETLVQRAEDSADDWDVVPDDDMVDAEVAVRVKEARRKESLEKGAIFSIRISRGTG